MELYERYFRYGRKTQGEQFAGGHRFELLDVKIEVTTPFGQSLITAMDDRPIMSRGSFGTAVAKERWTCSDIEALVRRTRSPRRPPLMMEPVRDPDLCAEFDSPKLSMSMVAAPSKSTPDAGAHHRWTIHHRITSSSANLSQDHKRGSDEMDLPMNPADMPSDDLDEMDAEKTGVEGGARMECVDSAV